MSFRYYLYVSDTKIDMLLSQVDPGFMRKGTSELSVGPKFLGAKRTMETPPSDRFTRLERVVRHLEDFGDVGTVDEPGQFFWGLLPMQWGPIQSGAGASIVYFGGRTESTVLGLGGSAGHVLGTSVGGAPDSEDAAPRDQALAPSMMPALLAGLTTEDTGHPTGAAEEGPDGESAALASVHQASARLRGPAPTMEFLAKRLLWGPSPYPELDGDQRKSVLLGSPLFVALVD